MPRPARENISRAAWGLLVVVAAVVSVSAGQREPYETASPFVGLYQPYGSPHVERSRGIALMKGITEQAGRDCKAYELARDHMLEFPGVTDKVLQRYLSAASRRGRDPSRCILVALAGAIVECLDPAPARQDIFVQSANAPGADAVERDLKERLGSIEVVSFLEVHRALASGPARCRPANWRRRSAHQTRLAR